MDGHHFISYSTVDADDFAGRLYNALLAGSPSFLAWLDKEKLRPGEEWDEQINEAIRACASLLFVMTPDSVDSLSVVKNEWTRALKYKKPILPILLNRDAEMPFRLGSRQYIDFTVSFDVGLARLRRSLDWLGSPEGELQTLKYRLQDAQRDLRRAGPEERTRIQDEIDTLQRQIARQEQVVKNPQEAEERVQKSIETGKQRERQPEKPVGGTTRTKFINPPPVAAPSYFQDRHVETTLIGDFIKDEAFRLMTVVGRGGTGKSAMVCRLLKSLERGRLPDEGGPLSVDGIVYLSELGSRGVSVPYLYVDLCELLPDDVAQELDKIYKNPQASIEAKMHALLDAFPDGRYVLLLDNFENVIDPETPGIKDAELRGALRTILEHPHHAIKVIVTTRLPLPEDLATVRPEKQRRIDLDEGLDSPFAENILREMDADGKVGLKTASDEVLAEARKRTRGFPRALEAFFAILSSDRNTTLQDILSDTEALLPDKVVEVLVGEAFSRLDPISQMVMQALATYGYPVTPAAVDYLLLPHRIGGVDSAPVLGRLVNMQFVRKEFGSRYYLHPVDRAYALLRVPEGEEADRYELEAPPFTRSALLHRAADYFAQTRLPRENWKTIEDLASQLHEFELRYAGQDYDTAASVLREIDSEYLQTWGHHRLSISLNERLRGKVSDATLQLNNAVVLSFAYTAIGQYRYAIGYAEEALAIARESSDRLGEVSALRGLGNGYFVLGQLHRALDCYEQALAIDREIGNRREEATDLGALANVDYALGQRDRAIHYFEQALAIVREFNDRQAEAILLTNLGNVYGVLGQRDRAIHYYEQALAIDREIGDRDGVATDFVVLGNVYYELGQRDRAVHYFEQALAIVRETGNRRVEAASLASLGYGLFVQDEYSKAEPLLRHAIRIADEIEEQSLQCEARVGLAECYLYVDDLTSAQTTIVEAYKFESQGYNYALLSLAGVIVLRTGNSDAAKEAFQAAVAQAEAQLSYSEQVYGAHDAKGLALCGLALAAEDEGFVPPATDAYRKAREITKDAGIVADVLRLFDALKPADSEGMLSEIRAVAAGTEDSSR